MNIDFYIKNKFKKIGYLTIVKPIDNKEKKHGVYFIGNPPKSKGVYIIAKDQEVLKFGDTNASDGMQSRIQNYLSNPEPTNVWIRENLKKEKYYDIYFFEIIPKLISIMGVTVEESISPRSLEKALIENYIKSQGKKPRLNKSSK